MRGRDILASSHPKINDVFPISSLIIGLFNRKDARKRYVVMRVTALDFYYS